MTQEISNEYGEKTPRLKRYRAYYKTAIVSFAVILLWLSLFFSERPMDPQPYIGGSDCPECAFLPVSHGGFPFVAFYYPAGAMGNDEIPSESWLPFLYNFIVWFLVSLVLVNMWPATFLSKTKPYLYALGALLITLLGYMYLMLAYD